MKTMLLKISFIFLFLSLMGAGCEKDEDSDYVEGYIVGSFQCNDYDGRGFCIILANNADSLWTISLPENIFDFPAGVIKSGHDAFSGGPYFFPDSLRYEFNIGFRYRQPDKSKVIDCPLAFNTMGVSFPWENWNCVIVEDVSKLLN
ncbi:MAG: hypothetical protein Q8S54_01045 [Bacteroidota bacterium]|nr:hypothetical protein [Bacteroidota bacterium]